MNVKNKELRAALRETEAAVMAIMGRTSKASSDRYAKLEAKTLRGTIE